jgi:hypothetical protein
MKTCVPGIGYVISNSMEAAVTTTNIGVWSFRVHIAPPDIGTNVHRTPAAIAPPKDGCKMVMTMTANATMAWMDLTTRL